MSQQEEDGTPSSMKVEFLTVHIAIRTTHSGDDQVAVTDSCNEHFRALEQSGVILDWEYDSDYAGCTTVTVEAPYREGSAFNEAALEEKDNEVLMSNKVQELSEDAVKLAVARGECHIAMELWSICGAKVRDVEDPFVRYVLSGVTLILWVIFACVAIAASNAVWLLPLVIPSVVVAMLVLDYSEKCAARDRSKVFLVKTQHALGELQRTIAEKNK